MTPHELQAWSCEVYGNGRRPTPPPCPSVFPFGHYRGQPMHIVARDHLYADALLREPWFRTQYAAVAEILMILREKFAKEEIDGGCVLYRPRFGSGSH
jgi:hypothetical protein